MSQAVVKGDRVRVTIEGEARPYGEHDLEVVPRGGGYVAMFDTYFDSVTVEKLDPEPRPRFRVGDRVILKYLLSNGVGEVVYATKHNSFEVVFQNYKYPPGCAVNVKGVGAGTFGARALEAAPDQTFKLKWGDRIRNTKTGRVGVVAVGADGHLWVVDPSTYDEETGATAAAVEEYEEYYPGTYEIISREGGPF